MNQHDEKEEYIRHISNDGSNLMIICFSAAGKSSF
jgi:hypothetical protein